MPKISEAARLDRRRYVLESAWKCFSREGFHATSMDDVIAETGMSSSSVYRYFRSKEELIDAAAEETLSQTYSAISALISDDAVPGPAETLENLIAGLRERQQGEFDLTKISMSAWAEGLRRPAMHDFAYDFYAKMNDVFVTLTRRWIGAGMLPKNTDPETLAKFLVTLMPGLLVMSHLYELPASETLVRGIADFAKATARQPTDRRRKPPAVQRSSQRSESVRRSG